MSLPTKCTALRGLPFVVKEKPDGLLKTCLNTDPEESYVKELELGLLAEDDVGTVRSSPTTLSIALIIEERIVMDDICDIPTAFALLFGLLYALNLEYPKDMRYTFEVIQKLFMNLGPQCSAWVQSLKNSLLK